MEIRKSRSIACVSSVLAAVFTSALCLVVTTSASAAPIPAGIDLFETVPGQTQFTFPPSLIPPGFFGQGSDSFSGQVQFGGIPLGQVGGHPTGDADTAVQRQGIANPTPIATVPIQLFKLSLESIEPITVTYNGGQKPELWNIDASPSPTRPSQGQISINQNGTFSSNLNVLPLLVFTRLSDGAQRSFDTATLPQIFTQQLLTFISQNVPWSPRCTLPALDVPGVNSGFCPSFFQGRKVLTIEHAMLADHGIVPAQPQLEHFKCYTLARDSFKHRTVQLTDQFGTRTATVNKRAELCNPVQKNGERFFNKPAHQQCYSTTGPAVKKLVAVQNQFGSQRLLVGAPRRLCVPTQKQLLHRQTIVGVRIQKKKFKKIAVPIDHYLCYSVNAQTPLRARQKPGTVRLSDEFGTEKVKLGRPFQLCAPVQKRFRNRTAAMQHPVRHLVCYRIRDRKVRRVLAIRNQFETRVVLTKKPVALCVPSNKLVIR